jgi:hypothetical protein
MDLPMTDHPTMRRHESTDETDRLEPARALLHPAWLGAFALLVINDHLLKATLSAPWLTGKLSDVAGLLVAPVLLAALLRVGRLRGVAMSAVCVGAVFAAINLSPAAAEVWDGLMGAVGIGWKTYPDPTDCLALAVLPISIRLFESRMRTAWERPGERGAAFVLAVVGLVGCAATSPPPPGGTASFEYPARLSLLNKTHELQVIRLQQLADDTTLDCDRVAEAPGEYLRAEAFGEPIRWELFSGQQIPIDNSDRRLRNLRRASTLEPDECRATRITLETADDIVVFWDGSLEPKTFVHRTEDPKEELGGPQTIELTADYSDADEEDVREFRWQPCEDADMCGQEGRREAAQIPEGTRYAWKQQNPDRRHFYTLPNRTERDRGAPPPRCTRPARRAGLAWEPLPGARRRVEGLEQGADGCHTLTLSPPGDDNDQVRDFMVCAPWEAVSNLAPEADSERVFVRTNEYDGGPHIGGIELAYQIENADGELLGGGNVGLAYGTSPGMLVAEGATLVRKEECGPLAAACGQTDVAAKLQLEGGGAPTTLQVGESAPVAASSETTVHLVRAFQRAVARTSEDCSDEEFIRSTLGPADGKLGYLEVVTTRETRND